MASGPDRGSKVVEYEDEAEWTRQEDVFEEGSFLIPPPRPATNLQFSEPHSPNTAWISPTAPTTEAGPAQPPAGLGCDQAAVETCSDREADEEDMHSLERESLSSGSDVFEQVPLRSQGCDDAEISTGKEAQQNEHSTDGNAASAAGMESPVKGSDKDFELPLETHGLSENDTDFESPEMEKGEATSVVTGQAIRHAAAAANDQDTEVPSCKSLTGSNQGRGNVRFNEVVSVHKLNKDKELRPRSPDSRHSVHDAAASAVTSSSMPPSSTRPQTEGSPREGCGRRDWRAVGSSPSPGGPEEPDGESDPDADLPERDASRIIGKDEIALKKPNYNESDHDCHSDDADVEGGEEIEAYHPVVLDSNEACHLSHDPDIDKQDCERVLSDIADDSIVEEKEAELEENFEKGILPEVTEPMDEEPEAEVMDNAGNDDQNLEREVCGAEDTAEDRPCKEEALAEREVPPEDTEDMEEPEDYEKQREMRKQLQRKLGPLVRLQKHLSRSSCQGYGLKNYAGEPDTASEAEALVLLEKALGLWRDCHDDQAEPPRNSTLDWILLKYFESLLETAVKYTPGYGEPQHAVSMTLLAEFVKYMKEEDEVRAASPDAPLLDYWSFRIRVDERRSGTPDAAGEPDEAKLKLLGNADDEEKPQKLEECMGVTDLAMSDAQGDHCGQAKRVVFSENTEQLPKPADSSLADNATPIHGACGIVESMKEARRSFDALDKSLNMNKLKTEYQNAFLRSPSPSQDGDFTATQDSEGNDLDSKNLLLRRWSDFTMRFISLSGALAANIPALTHESRRRRTYERLHADSSDQDTDHIGEGWSEYSNVEELDMASEASFSQSGVLGPKEKLDTETNCDRPAAGDSSGTSCQTETIRHKADGEKAQKDEKPRSKDRSKVKEPTPAKSSSKKVAADRSKDEVPKDQTAASDVPTPSLGKDEMARSDSAFEKMYSSDSSKILTPSKTESLVYARSDTEKISMATDSESCNIKSDNSAREAGDSRDATRVRKTKPACDGDVPREASGDALKKQPPPKVAAGKRIISEKTSRMQVIRKVSYQDVSDSGDREEESSTEASTSTSSSLSCDDEEKASSEDMELPEPPPTTKLDGSIEKLFLVCAKINPNLAVETLGNDLSIYPPSVRFFAEKIMESKPIRTAKRRSGDREPQPDPSYDMKDDESDEQSEAEEIGDDRIKCLRQENSQLRIENQKMLEAYNEIMTQVKGMQGTLDGEKVPAAVSSERLDRKDRDLSPSEEECVDLTLLQNKILALAKTHKEVEEDADLVLRFLENLKKTEQPCTSTSNSFEREHKEELRRLRIQLATKQEELVRETTLKLQALDEVSKLKDRKDETLERSSDSSIFLKRQDSLTTEPKPVPLRRTPRNTCLLPEGPGAPATPRESSRSVALSRPQSDKTLEARGRRGSEVGLERTSASSKSFKDLLIEKAAELQGSYSDLAVKDLQEKLQALTMENECMRSRDLAQSRTIHQLREENKVLMTRLNARTMSSAQLKEGSATDAIARELANLRAEVDALHERCEALTLEKADVESRLMDASQRLKNKTLDARIQKHIQSKFRRMEAEIKKSHDLLRTRDEELHKVSTGFAQLKNELAKQTKMNLYAQDQISDLERNIESLRQELNVKNKLLSSYTCKQVNNFDQLYALQDTLDKLQHTLNQKNMEVRSLGLELFHERERSKRQCRAEKPLDMSENASETRDNLMITNSTSSLMELKPDQNNNAGENVQGSGQDNDAGEGGQGAGQNNNAVESRKNEENRKDDFTGSDDGSRKDDVGEESSENNNALTRKKDEEDNNNAGGRSCSNCSQRSCMEMKLSMLEEERDKLRMEILNFTRRLQAMEENYHDARRNLSKVSQELVREKSLICQCSSEKIELERQLRAANTDREMLYCQKQKAEEDLRRLEEKINDMLGRFETCAKQEMESISCAKFPSDTARKMQVELHAVHAYMEEKEGEIENLKDKIHRLEADRCYLERRLEQTQAEMHVIKEEKDRVAADLMTKMQENWAIFEINQGMVRERGEMQRHIDNLHIELKVEREYTNKLKAELEAALLAAANAANAANVAPPVLAKPSMELKKSTDSVPRIAPSKTENTALIAELQRQIDRLTAENDMLKQTVNLGDEKVSDLAIVKAQIIQFYAVIEEQKNVHARIIQALAEEHMTTAECQDIIEKQEKALEEIFERVNALIRDTERVQRMLCQLKQERDAISREYDAVCCKLQATFRELDRVSTEKDTIIEMMKNSAIEDKEKLHSQEKALFNTRSLVKEMTEKCTELEHMRKNVECARHELAKAKSYIESKEAELGECMRKYERLEVCHKERVIMVESLRNELLAVNEANANLQEELDKLGKDRNNLDHALKHERARSEDSITELKQSICCLKSAHECEQRMLSESLKKTEASLRMTEVQLKDTQDKLNAAIIESRSLQREVTDLRTSFMHESSLRKEAEHCADHVRHQQEEFRMCKTRLEETLFEIESELRARLEELNHERSNNMKLFNRNKELEATNHVNHENIHKANEISKQLRDEIDTMHRQFDKEKEHIMSDYRCQLEENIASREHLQMERDKYFNEANRISFDLEQLRDQLLIKNEENKKMHEALLLCQEKLVEKDAKLRQIHDALHVEEEMQNRLTRRYHEQKDEIERLNNYLRQRVDTESDGEGKTKWTEVQRMIAELGRKMLERNREERTIEELKKINMELETKLTTERKLHAITKTSLAALEEDCARLRKQMHTLHTRCPRVCNRTNCNSDPLVDTDSLNNSGEVSRMDEINEIIARCQTRAQTTLSGSDFNLDGTFKHDAPTRDYQAPEQDKDEAEEDPIKGPPEEDGSTFSLSEIINTLNTPEGMSSMPLLELARRTNAKPSS